MAKRIVIAGCRDFNDYITARGFIEECVSDILAENEIIILSGGCRGADLLGERFAREKGYKVERHSADWKKYGRAAGPIRNENMAKVCDLLICFWDGKSRGTKNMIEVAKSQNRKVFIKRIE